MASPKSRKEFLKIIWDEVRKNCDKDGKPTFAISDVGFTGTRVNECPAIIVRMPPPAKITEAYFVGIVLRIDVPAASASEAPRIEYVTLEKGQRDGAECTYLCAWKHDGGRVNYGKGPPATEADFLKALETLLKSDGGYRPVFIVPPKAALAQQPVAQPAQPGLAQGEPYKKGDRIDKFEVHSLIGRGGFGLVYLVYDRQSREGYALKTFRDEFLADPAVREAFKREALLWVTLDEHPFILVARWVVEVSGRLFVQMDYVAPDKHGRVSLDDHFRQASGPLDVDQSLRWAIQFCLGMEHANSHGIRCHRDIKPSNVLIAQDGTLKIADFGVAAAAEMVWRPPTGKGGSLISAGADAQFGLSLFQTEGKNLCGTPGYMAPEVYCGEGAGVRSDIYSFGLVLWQMATGSPTHPFHVAVPHRGNDEQYLHDYMEAVHQKQMAGKVPWVDGPLRPIIEGCLAAESSRRYSDFGQLRKDLEVLYRQRTGRAVEVPLVGEKTVAFWSNKGASLGPLGRHQEAIACYDKALEIDPRHANAWANKGNCLHSIGRYQEAIACLNEALEINPRFAGAWSNKGNSLNSLGRHQEAIACCDKALEIDPRLAGAWGNKGISLRSIGRLQEAIACHDKALEIDPRDAKAWANKGGSLDSLGRHQEAIACYDKALEIDPRFAGAWSNKGNSLNSLGRYQEAIACCDKALEIAPRLAGAWYCKATGLSSIGRSPEAIACFDKALEIDPRLAGAWYNKGLSLEWH